MRVIKFRIWDKGKNRWFHGGTEEKSISLQTDAINLFGEVITMGEILRDQNDDKMISLTRLKDLVALQFTGLVDKQGKEIYEGDIVKDLANNIYSVEYAPKYMAFMLSDNKIETAGEIDSSLKLIGGLANIEVIGNIYENQELLDKE